MSDILMTNIFFMIIAVASVVITVAVVISLIYIIKLVKKITAITKAVETETLKVMSDVEHVRNVVHENISLIKTAASATFLTSIIKKIFNKKDTKDYEKKDTEDCN